VTLDKFVLFRFKFYINLTLILLQFVISLHPTFHVVILVKKGTFSIWFLLLIILSVLII